MTTEDYRNFLTDGFSDSNTIQLWNYFCEQFYTPELETWENVPELYLEELGASNMHIQSCATIGKFSFCDLYVWRELGELVSSNSLPWFIDTELMIQLVEREELTYEQINEIL